MSLNNVATTDRYGDAASLFVPGSIRLRLRVRNASVFRQFGYGLPGGSIQWDPMREVFAPPGDESLDERERPFDAVRFRSATPGKPARITAEAVPRPLSDA